MTIEIKGDTVLKDGEAIGKIKGDTCILAASVGPTVKAAINRAHGDKLSFVVHREAVMGKLGAVPMTDEEIREGINRGPKVEVTTPAAPAELSDEELQRILKQRGLKLAVEPKFVEGEPIHLQNPAMGDKTPAFVEWFRANRSPAEFEKRYGHRKLPKSDAEFEAAERKARAKLKGVSGSVKMTEQIDDADA